MNGFEGSACSMDLQFFKNRCSVVSKEPWQNSRSAGNGPWQVQMRPDLLRPCESDISFYTKYPKYDTYPITKNSRVHDSSKLNFIFF